MALLPTKEEELQAEIDILKLELEWRKLTWEKVQELGKLVNEELPSENEDQAADEWGMHVVDIAINRLRAFERLRLWAIDLLATRPFTHIGRHMLDLLSGKQ